LPAQKFDQRHPTLSRLLSQVLGAERLNAGRTKLAGAQAGCPAVSPFIRPTSALSLDGVKVKSF